MKSSRLPLALITGLIVFIVMMFVQPARSTAQPVVITFPGIPCDSTVCDTLILHNTHSDPEQLLALHMRDSLSYTIAPGFAVPQTVAVDSSVAIPICFNPQRRGTITDSLLVVLQSSSGFDSIRVRLTGKGFGPSLDATPNVLNFPKTNPTFSNSLTMVIRNGGDLPFVLTAADLVIPPPFRLVTVLPLTIQPNDSIQIEVAFEPVEDGVFSAPVDLLFGCNTRLQLGLNGVTDLVGTGAVLRLSKTGFNPANNEQIACDSTRCTVLTLSNVGNAPLVIDDIHWLDGTLGYAITTSAPTPFIIAANSQRDIEVCLSSRERGTLRDTLLVTSNSRSSIAFGLVLDVSGSMVAKMLCGQDSSPRIDQAVIQAKNFIGRTLLYLPSVGILDQLAIMTYTSKSSRTGVTPVLNDIFPLIFINAPLRAAAQTALDGLVSSGGTPTGAALKHMISILKTSPLSNRVLVLLTDGEADGADQLSNPVNQIVALAQAQGIRIFTIGVGLSKQSARTYLSTLAQGTNGQSYDASDGDCSTLQAAFEAITDIVSRGAKNKEPFQMKVLSPLIVTVKDLKFDSVYVGGKLCQTITVTNAGEGDAVLDSIQFRDLLGGATAEFSLGPGVRFPLTIPESGQTDMSVCFSPEKIRIRNGKATFFYNSCGAQPVDMALTGPSFAAANLRVTDERAGLPGQTVIMPIYADTVLSAYGVNTIGFKVRWNKTMLDLRAVHPGLQAGGANVVVATPVTFDTHFATAEITATGTGLPGNGELAELEFEVLRGDTLATLVELTHGLFEDNNPHALLVNAGLVAFDSTCFRSSKPILGQAVAKVVAGEITPTPSRGLQLTLPVTSDGLAMVSLEVYSTDGSLVLGARDYQLIAGSNTLTIDMSGAASGSYYAALRTASGETLFRKILITR